MVTQRGFLDFIDLIRCHQTEKNSMKQIYFPYWGQAKKVAYAMPITLGNNYDLYCHEAKILQKICKNSIILQVEVAVSAQKVVLNVLDEINNEFPLELYQLLVAFIY